MNPEDLVARSLPDLLSLHGRVAVITGGGRGIGAAIARRLAEAGADLVIGDLNAVNATAVAKEMRRRFQVRTVAMRLDVTDSASVAALASSITASTVFADGGVSAI